MELSVSAMQLELTCEEEEAASRGNILPHEMSQSTFIQVGIELEEQQ